MPATTCKEAIKKWEVETGMTPQEATEVKLIALRPPMERMDENLNQFENCVKLSLSTNNIDRFIALPKLRNLKILSLGRNQISRIINLEEIG
jgi:dynein light chain 1, axonemal